MLTIRKTEFSQARGRGADVRFPGRFADRGHSRKNTNRRFFSRRPFNRSFNRRFNRRFPNKRRFFSRSFGVKNRFNRRRNKLRRFNLKNRRGNRRFNFRSSRRGLNSRWKSKRRHKQRFFRQRFNNRRRSTFKVQPFDSLFLIRDRWWKFVLGSLPLAFRRRGKFKFRRILKSLRESFVRRANRGRLFRVLIRRKAYRFSRIRRFKKLPFSIVKIVPRPYGNVISELSALKPLTDLKYIPGKAKKFFLKKLFKSLNFPSTKAFRFRPRFSAKFFFQLHRFMLRYSTYRLQRDLPVLNESLSKTYKISYFPIANDQLTVQLFSRFVVRRLAQRFNLFETVKVLQRFLANSNLRGYLLRCSGRFTKKQRSSVYTFRKGGAPVATVAAPVHYYDATVKLKYGACCIKTWIYR